VHNGGGESRTLEAEIQPQQQRQRLVDTQFATGYGHKSRHTVPDTFFIHSLKTSAARRTTLSIYLSPLLAYDAKMPRVHPVSNRRRSTPPPPQLRSAEIDDDDVQ